MITIAPSEPGRGGARGSRWLLNALLLGVMAMAWTSPACKRDQAAQPSVDDVTGAPSSYVGRELTLTGKVEHVFDRRAFALGSREPFGDVVLVLTRSDVRFGNQNVVAEGDELHVTGVVRHMMVPEVERALGWDLDPQLEFRFHDNAVLLAHAARSVERPALAWRDPAYRGARDGASAEVPVLTDVAVIAAIDDVRAFANLPVELPLVTVREVVSDRAFWVGGPAARARVLVVYGGRDAGAVVPSPSKLAAGQRIGLTGILREVPPPIERARMALTRRANHVLAGQLVYIAADAIDLSPPAPAAGRRPRR